MRGERILALFLAIIMALGLTGCSSSKREAVRRRNEKLGIDATEANFTPSVGEAPSFGAAAAGETVLYDNEYFSLKVTGVYFDQWSYSVKLLAENKTDEDMTITADTVTVNDAVCDPCWICDVDEGETEESELQWDVMELRESHVTDVKKIYMKLTAYPEDDWGADYYADGAEAVFYPQGESAYEGPDPAPEGAVIVSTEGFRMLSLGGGWNDSWEAYILNVYVENTSGREVFCTLEDSKINGRECEAWWSETVPTDCHVYGYIQWDEDELKRIDDVEEISLELQVWSSEDWSGGYLIDGEYTVRP